MTEPTGDDIFATGGAGTAASASASAAAVVDAGMAVDVATCTAVMELLRGLMRRVAAACPQYKVVRQGGRWRTRDLGRATNCPQTTNYRHRFNPRTVLTTLLHCPNRTRTSCWLSVWSFCWPRPLICCWGRTDLRRRHEQHLLPYIRLQWRRLVRQCTAVWLCRWCWRCRWVCSTLLWRRRRCGPWSGGRWSTQER